MTSPALAKTRPQRAPWRSALRAVAIVVAVLVLLPYAIAPLYRVVDPVSTPMLWRWLTGQRVERVVTPLEDISSAVPLTAIAAEDARFCTHHGVDFSELRTVLAEVDDLSDMRGGSTITQQTAKNLFLWPGRSYLRKALELPLALWLDLVLGKRRVMEIYLNIAQWGPTGEFGVEAASRRVFRKSAKHLTASEAALLAAMLPNPIKRDAAKPGRGMRRVAAVHHTRAAANRELARCLGLSREAREEVRKRASRSED